MQYTMIKCDGIKCQKREEAESKNMMRWLIVNGSILINGQNRMNNSTARHFCSSACMLSLLQDKTSENP